MKPTHHYVDNKQFCAALIKYRNERLEALEKGLSAPRIPEYIGHCILKIAQKLASKGNFVNYSYKEEMISDGIENCINYLNNFNPEKSNNPFAYFTRVIYNAYILRIHKEQKQTYIKYKSYENFMMDGSVHETGKVNTLLHSGTDVREHVGTFIADYEKKQDDKKAESKVKGIEKFVE